LVRISEFCQPHRASRPGLLVLERLTIAGIQTTIERFFRGNNGKQYGNDATMAF
jgi:hypothetical protein